MEGDMENHVAGAAEKGREGRSSTASQFTPGPWKPHDNPNSNYGLEVVANNAIKAKRVVCRIGGPAREANAHLIAAAPEMYAALKAAHPYVECCTEPNTPAEKALALLDAALRKAEGGV
jgi:hypothetical protein